VIPYAGNDQSACQKGPRAFVAWELLPGTSVGGRDVEATGRKRLHLQAERNRPMRQVLAELEAAAESEY